MMEHDSLKPEESDLRRTVLLVDDDQQLRKLLARVLDSHGWRVITASDGLSALQILDAIQVHAVIADLHFDRGLGGDTLLEEARKRYPGARLLLVSGWPTRVARERIADTGAVIIEKPFEITHLLRELDGGDEKT